MNSPCIPDIGYLDSPEFLSLASHLVTIISTPIHLIGTYCIIMKTPEQMKSAKYYLLNLHFWIIMFDYSFGILTIPLVLFPVIGGHPLGVLRYLGVSTLFQIVFICIAANNMLVSIVAIFESRFNTLCTFHWMKYWRRIRTKWLVVYYFVTMIPFIMFLFLVPDQAAASHYIIEKLPCLPEYIYRADNLILSINFSSHLIIVTLIGIIAASKVVFFGICLTWNIIQQLKAGTMSRKTYRMQRKFFFALVIQMQVPFITMAVPCIYGFISIVALYYNQALTNVCVIACSMHGIISTLVMILIHRPYRESVMKVFKKPVTVLSKEVSKHTFPLKLNSLVPIRN
uniref:Serpentine Receptor, class H n=1 Tax=Caenorhabditis tropicalis TaxID=1561998 RepID=A0A1I7TXZ8_9PELO